MESGRGGLGSHVASLETDAIIFGNPSQASIILVPDANGYRILISGNTLDITNALLGFFDADPVTQQQLDPATATTAQIVDVLELFGLTVTPA